MEVYVVVQDYENSTSEVLAFSTPDKGLDYINKELKRSGIYKHFETLDEWGKWQGDTPDLKLTFSYNELEIDAACDFCYEKGT